MDSLQLDSSTSVTKTALQPITSYRSASSAEYCTGISIFLSILLLVSK